MTASEFSVCVSHRGLRTRTGHVSLSITIALQRSGLFQLPSIGCPCAVRSSPGFGSIYESSELFSARAES